MNQQKAPLWEALVKHAHGAAAQLHIPGHRSGQAIPPEFLQLAGQAVFTLDVTEIPGLDDLHNPQGPLAEAMALAAAAYGAEQSFMLVNGTSCGLMALIMACCGPGDKIMVPRNAHRSVVSGLILSGAHPVYYQPGVLDDFACLTGPDVCQIKQLLKENREVKAVLAVNPTYYGVAGDIAALAGLCHAAGIPLLVDEAHGAHLRFHPQLPPDALSCGADAVVQSTHKTAGSLTQSALLHVQGARVDRSRLAEALRMLQSTSPSYLLLASLDTARRQLALQGRQLLDQALVLARRCRKQLAGIAGVKVLSRHHLGGAGAAWLDPTRLTVSLLPAGLTGYQTADLLHRRYQVNVEMADAANVVAVISIGTREEDCRQLIKAVAELAGAAGAPVCWPALPQLPAPEVALPPREAWQHPGQYVALEKCLDLISGETVAVYPPGIPVVCPGEVIRQPVLEYLLAVRQQGVHIQGPADHTLRSLRVLR
ncbi:aminotransferase class I/II-fold pyridoxal phosphate-dependent enzyme [Desulforamulus hydrothermalis]|uniref:Arginine decarboxylase n=1 Tax=Desulforamulus hydrothermalis Lam5 = DSM 18033 TaxID=1121428 RepID=K8DZT0_9FIRM|nr:aminotransferase class I/II-fold pyridoxal phosphate-dependent enzyme [Desulforamulus hydrothermalis]CCO08560.1 Arginine decarboxylase [Desulforamulus hydrothermalis Lam5 = DSM 18033]SHH02190.1 arginine decarboxylase [Desulforamulus hydrothermalis Lam5 = DSM 18033]